MERIISKVVPYNPYRCRSCLQRAMYRDYFFGDRQRVICWALGLVMLGTFMILSSLKTSAPIESSTTSSQSSLQAQSGNDVPSNDTVESVITPLSEAQQAELEAQAQLELAAAREADSQASESESVDRTAQEIARIKDLIEGWRRAWESSRADDYLSAYSEYFVSNEGASYQQWRNKRQRVVGRLETRVIVLNNIQVIISESGDTAQATFEQNYRSETYGDVVLKTLELHRNPRDEWKILKETSAN